MRRVLLLWLFAGPLLAGPLIGDFTQQGLDDWQGKSFVGETRYTLQQLGEGKVLRAESEASASGLFREIKVDLRKTPYLNWRWRVDKLPAVADELSKPGDDFAARVYVVVSGGVWFWRTRALNYVWSNSQPVGSAWASPYTDNARLIALDSGSAGLGEWRSHKRNLLLDLQQQFGKEIRFIDGVAIMSDSDDSQSSTTAYYGEIFFTAD